MMQSSYPPVTSPCTRLCQLDRADFCVGCFRTRTEIAGWLGMGEAEKRQVWARLDERRKRSTLDGRLKSE